MNILIIAHHYPPLNKAASSRPYSWAKAWADEGHAVCVLTTKKKAKQGSPLNYNPPPITKGSVVVKELDYWSYSGLRKNRCSEKSYSPRSSRSFASAGVLQPGDGLSEIRTSMTPLPLLKLWWTYPAVKYARYLYRIWPYDVVVSTFSPVASHIIASLLRRKKNIFWVADYRDLWTGNPVTSPIWPLSAISTHVEKHYLQRADLITTVSDPLKTQLQSLLRKPTVTIENGFDPQEFPRTGGRYFPDDNKVRLVYTGSLYPGKRDPSPLFRAIQELKLSDTANIKNLSVLFYGPGSEYLDTLIALYDVSDYVAAGGYVDRKTCLRIQSEADALLFFEWNDASVQGMVTSKLFEYIYSGTPIISFGPPGSDAAGRIIEEAGAGVVLNTSVQDIKSVIAELLCGKPPPCHVSNSFLKRYDRKYLAMKMLAEITESLRH